VELWVENKKYLFPYMKSYLDTHLRVVHYNIDWEKKRVVLGHVLLNFGSHSRPKFERSGIMGLKEKIFVSTYEIIFGYPFESCTLQS
jgi:hypothetical protein